jgi:hypothetical protein
MGNPQADLSNPPRVYENSQAKPVRERMRQRERERDRAREKGGRERRVCELLSRSEK